MRCPVGVSRAFVYVPARSRSSCPSIEPHEVNSGWPPGYRAMRRRPEQRAGQNLLLPPDHTTSAMPPAAATRRESCRTPEQRKQSHPTRLAPYGLRASHNVTGSPPETATFFRCVGVKNPIHWPSGEKNGLKAPSVPAMTLESNWSRGRR